MTSILRTTTTMVSVSAMLSSSSCSASGINVGSGGGSGSLFSSRSSTVSVGANVTFTKVESDSIDLSNDAKSFLDRAKITEIVTDRLQETYSNYRKQLLRLLSGQQSA